MSHRRRTGLALAMLFAFGELLALGQSTAGRINGRVSDPAGAVIPGAQVTITNTETGLEQHKATAPDGTFIFPNLAAGTYNARAGSAGFADLERTGIQLFAD